MFSLAKIPSAPRENGAFRLRGNLKRKKIYRLLPVESYTTSSRNKRRESFEGGVLCKQVREIYSLFVLRMLRGKKYIGSMDLYRGKRNGGGTG